ncbi:MAG: hypothetical protein N3B01_03685 [Verrucomicrobiae bacterium]|nr:hypothetical protein [Verrucomicrobiae bacterium]
MRHWKVILGVTAVFLLGALAGALLMHRIYQKRIRSYVRNQAAVSSEWIVRQMSRQLKLTAEQREKLLPVINDTRRRLNEIRVESEPKIRETFQDMERQIREILTPEQRDKFDKLSAEHKKRWARSVSTPSR